MPSVAKRTTKKIRKASPSETPRYLTHYTDLAGFQGIIANKQMWLSHAGFLNDPEELQYGVNRANAVLQKLLKGQDADDGGRLKLVSDIARDFAKFQPPDAYIACFCQRSDLLSQWRGYASRQGVSITFKTEELLRAFAGMEAELHQVVYGINESNRALKSAIEDELPDIIDDVQYLIGSLKDSEIRQSFSDLITKMVPRFKHFGFREEQEWRIVVTSPAKRVIKFRPRGQLLLPYIELDAKGKTLAIEDITIGPGVNDDAVKKSIQFFLRQHGYDPEIVDPSSTPYRT
ncbi:MULTISPECIES: DUF2971 domain-containing protein [unclassified Sinorhizobium]|uniref:DUF2971 domain-containing protein n=1 Tax=unclassified Sinorhizobium TaxID=2613772 RepID=UPI0024C2A565|nr:MULTISPECIES: DUF2971 domain-containing protein [unclassified Sinorhizobium]MDK1377225.1 DUF2971 domain-containing protein [Sinorhizobium sp. 6-70]MDK1478809.1 DUF2971 domain-containing protein [Sinorhizobium sp. 6-117]